jgi:hypothetical protein
LPFSQEKFKESFAIFNFVVKRSPVLIADNEKPGSNSKHMPLEVAIVWSKVFSIFNYLVKKLFNKKDYFFNSFKSVNLE